MAKRNPFDNFIAENKKAYIKSLDYEITYRELTMAEADALNKRLLKNYDKDTGAEFDMSEATKIAYEKLETCLIDPKMTAEELQALGSSATSAINEIVRLIDGAVTLEENVDTEGNSED